MIKTYNDYVITGTRRQAGAIGIVEPFREEIEAQTSRRAYLTVLHRPGFELVHVEVIKIRCAHCNEPHITVPSDLYLY